LKIKDF